jgi:hypothetical protein
MKTGLIACLLVTCVPLCAQPALNEEEIAALKKSYYREIDDVRGITFMMPSSMPLNFTSCYLYIADNANSNLHAIVIFPLHPLLQ